VERRRTASLRGAGMLDPGRSFPPVAQRLVVAETLGQFDAPGADAAISNTDICCYTIGLKD